MNQIPIKEYELVRKDLIKSFTICVMQVELYKSVTLSVCLYDKDEIMIKSVYMTIEGEEYAGWGMSDRYLVELVAKKLGFELDC